MAHMNTSVVRHMRDRIVQRNTTVSHHEDPQEAVDDPREVQDNSHPDRPAVLEEKRQQHSLHRAGILVSADSLTGVDVADMRVVALPRALHT